LYPRPVANGLAWFQVGDATLEESNATEAAFVEPSTNGAPETVFNKNKVPDIAVSGVVEGVKLPV
jgi:hypothetical protein